MKYQNHSIKITIAAAMVAGMLSAIFAVPSASAAASPTLDLKLLLVGSANTNDSVTAAWVSELTSEGVPYTEVSATGTAGSETVALPALSSGTTTGYFNGVVLADSPSDFAAGALSTLDSYEQTFRVRQIDGYTYPIASFGLTVTSCATLDGTIEQLIPAGLVALPALAGPVPMDIGTYGCGATVTTGAPFTPWVEDTSGNVLAGVYQHPNGTDPQTGVSELALDFNYNPLSLQWLLLAPGLINWVTQGTHLGLYQNYVEMDIDDTFTPDDAWNTTTHEIDYTDTDSLRMTPQDVISAAQWSQANHFRLDQLFNYGSAVAAQAGDLAFAGSTVDSGVATPDPLLAQFQALDPTTGKPYADDFGWISHTYDTPYLDVGCATQNYIEAELNENTNTLAAAPGTTPGTGGLGVISSTNDALAYGYQDPQVFVPGNHSGFADLVPGNPATVDEPDLDAATAGAAASGTLLAGTYEYAVTDQFTDSTSAGQSAAYVTAPIVVPANGSVTLQWEAICHASNYLVYRSEAPYTSWSLIDDYSTPFSTTLPDNSSGNPASVNDVTNGGELAETYTDIGTTGTAEPSWTPPVTENAVESPWEQNPYFVPALEAAGIAAVGADASKPYPNPPGTQFGYGVNYTGAEYAAGQTFVDGTAQVVPRHPINVYYNVSTDAQELDEYNTLFTPTSSGGQCVASSTTTCETTPATFAGVTSSVVTQMLQYMLTNNPEPSYVHQTNLIGILPGCTATTWAQNPDTCGTPPSTTCTAASCMPSTPDTQGDGTLYSVLNPLLADYSSYFSAATPYVQLTEGQIATVLAEQAAWATTANTSAVNATEQNGVVTVSNSGPAINVPLTVPSGTTTGATTFGQPYGGSLIGWDNLATGGSIVLQEAVAPTIISAASTTANVGAAFSFLVNTTGEPAPSLAVTAGTLPVGITLVDNGNGTATIAGTPIAGAGGTYPFTITATNAAGTATQAFVLTTTQAPTITSPATATFVTTLAGTYNVTTTGYPAPSIAEAGTLPTGLGFVDSGNGTGTISGTPDATDTAGTYLVTLQAANASGSTATLDLTITVETAAAPAISTATGTDTAYFTQNLAGSFAISTTGAPTAAITGVGTLPAGLFFVDNGNGTALLSGTSTVTGTYTLAITASNGVNPNATLNLTVIVGQAPAITSANNDTVTVSQPFSFTVETSGYPAPSIGQTGLPAGLSFVDHGNGTATISGTPSMAEVKVNTMQLTATNGTGSVDQTFTLTVAQAPVFTSAAATTFTVGTAGTYEVTTDGLPAPTLAETGALPSGVTFVDNRNGTGTLSGTPTAGSGSAWFITLNATNSDGHISQNFSLTVNEKPAVTSASAVTATIGTAFTFTVRATGFPTPGISTISTLPAGLRITDNADGTATISGTPTGNVGTVPIQLIATNTAGSSNQTLAITVANAPVILIPIGPVSPVVSTTTPLPSPPTTLPATTLPAPVSPSFVSHASTRAMVNRTFSFAVITNGAPTAALTHSKLPKGLKWTDHSNGTATIWGVPTTAAVGLTRVLLSATNSTGKAKQILQIIVQRRAGINGNHKLSAAVGHHFKFMVVPYGYPAPTIKESGRLPAGVKFTRQTNHKAVLSGTPEAGTAGTYHIRITVANSLGKTTMNYTLSIAE